MQRVARVRLTTVSSRAFAVAAPHILNTLPTDVVAANSLSIFRQLLKRFYRAMLCIRGTSHGPVSVRLSVCPSQVGVLLKRLSGGSHKQHHTIAQGL